MVMSEAGRQNLAESPAQLLLEAASAKLTTSKRITTSVVQKNTPSKSYADAGIAAKASESQTVGAKRSVGAAGDALNKVAHSVQVASPVKQREYRHPDGRKRIIPEAIGVISQQENISGGSHFQALCFPLNSSEHKKDDKGVTYTDGAAQGLTVRRSLGGSSDIKECSGVTARAAISESLVIEKVPESVCLEARLKNVLQMTILQLEIHL